MMGQPGDDPDLTLESLGTECGGQLRAQDLDRHRARILEVVGQEHGGHAAAAELALQRVAAGERGVQLIDEIGHDADSPSTGVKLRAPRSSKRKANFGPSMSRRLRHPLGAREHRARFLDQRPDLGVGGVDGRG